MVNIIKQIIHNIQLSSGFSDVKKTLIKQNSNDTHILSIAIRFSVAERTKLSGIATGANKYTHPASAAGAKPVGCIKS